MIQEITDVQGYSTQLQDSGLKYYFFPDFVTSFMNREYTLHPELSRLLGHADSIGMIFLLL